MWFRKKKPEATECVHTWFLADYEAGYFNAGTSVDIEDYFILRCNKCGGKRRVDEYELGKLRRYGLIKEVDNNGTQRNDG
ncbi:hypothetical protein HNP81_002874 [Peribacillus huizhouensis]|uniref:Uncharacterized protein n=1 Tax=Peribacillus huizhouensis TaxID=1501239 RepID=A0ABR6CRC1_9BACI|nr:hypothetical protein [Peribacillus huizhouensis]